MGFGRSRGDRRLGAACQDGLLCDPAQHDGAGDRTERRFLAVDDGVQQVDADEIGKSAGGDVRQFLGGAGHVQGAADAGAGFVHDGQSTPGPVLFGVVEYRGGNAVHLAVLILQRENEYGPAMLAGLAGSTVVVFLAHHLPGPQHLFLQLVDLLKGRIGFHFPQAQPAHLLFRPSHHAGHRLVDSHKPRLMVVDRHRDRELGQRPVFEHCRLGAVRFSAVRFSAVRVGVHRRASHPRRGHRSGSSQAGLRGTVPRVLPDCAAFNPRLRASARCWLVSVARRYWR